MQTTTISWADYSLNTVTGCTRAGPECYDAEREELVCYAEFYTRTMQVQREDPPEYVSEEAWTADNAGEVVTVHEHRLDDPFAYTFPKGPGKVFVCDMSDLFHPEVPAAHIRRTIELARQFPEHIWIFLTKRPGRAAGFDVEWPANTWLGTSVGSGPGGQYPDTTHRIDQLREADAPLLWVSFEPLIEPIGEVDLSGIGWVVVGGESRSNGHYRPMEHVWARELLQQARAGDVPFYFKQSAGRFPETGTALTVERTAGNGVFYEQREIREYPTLPEVTKRARSDREHE